VISRRKYAVRRGVSEKAIRKAIANGRIVSAVLEDGTSGAGKADELLASSTVAGVRVSTTLAEARRRKAAASAALIQDEIADMEQSLCPVAVAAVIEAEDIVWTYAKRRFMANVLPCSDRIVRQPAEVVFAILMDAVDRALHEIFEHGNQAQEQQDAEAEKGQGEAACRHDRRCAGDPPDGATGAPRRAAPGG
jgi:hypothetical protein